MEDSIARIETHAGLDRYLEYVQASRKEIPEILFRIAELSCQKTKQKGFDRNEHELAAKQAKAALIKCTVARALELTDRGEFKKLPEFFRKVSAYYTLLVSSHSAIHHVGEFRNLSQKEQNSLLSQLKKDIVTGRDYLNVEGHNSRDPQTFSLYERFKINIAEETKKTMQGAMGELSGFYCLRESGATVQNGDLKSDIAHGADLWIFLIGKTGIANRLPVQIKTHTSLPFGDKCSIEYSHSKLNIAFLVPGDFLTSDWIKDHMPPPKDEIEKFKNMLQSSLNERK